MSSLDGAWEESHMRRQEVAVRNLTFSDPDYKKSLEDFSKELKEKGHAVLRLPEHVKRREARDSLYIMQPVLNHYKELRGEPLVYI